VGAVSLKKPLLKILTSMVGHLSKEEIDK